MPRVTANGYFDAEDSEQVRFEKRKALNTQRTEDYKNGAYALAGGVVDPLSEDAPLPDASPRPQQRYHRSGGSWSWACRSGDRLEEARSGLSYLPVA